jgi:hypothetical protein
MQQGGRWDKFRSRLCAKSDGGDAESKSAAKERCVRASPGRRFPNRNSKDVLGLSVCSYVIENTVMSAASEIPTMGHACAQGEEWVAFQHDPPNW